MTGRDMIFRVLGPITVGSGDPVHAPTAPKIRAVRAALMVSANRVVPTDALIGELWGEKPPATARTAVHVPLSHLRRELPDDVRPCLLTEPPGYVVQASADGIDLHRFEERGADAGAELAGCRVEGALAGPRGALGLGPGPALAHVGLGPLLAGTAARAEELHMVARVHLLTAAICAGRHGGVVGELHSPVTEQPLHEHAYALLMLALARSGRQAEALETYRHLRARLGDERGIVPSRRLQRPHETILRGEPGLDSPAWLLSPPEAGRPAGGRG